MGTILYNYIRQDILLMKPLHKSQYAYQRDNSIETALYDLVTHLENYITPNQQQPKSASMILSAPG